MVKLSENTIVLNNDSYSSVSGGSKRLFISPLPSYRAIRTTPEGVHLARSDLSTCSTAIEPLTFRDLGFSLDNLNVEVQKQRIKYVLDNAIKKLELTMNLPRLVETKASLLRRYCTASEMNTIMECYAKYTGICTSPDHSPKRKTHFSLGRSAVKSSKKRIQSTVTWSTPGTNAKGGNELSTRKKRLYPLVATVIDILCKSTVLRRFAQETDLNMSGTESVMLFLEKIRILRDLLLERMNTPLSSERHRDIVMQRIWVKNEQLKAEISHLKPEVESLINKCNNQLIEKDNIIADYERQIKHLREQFEDQYNAYMKTSEATMKKRLNKSVMVQDDILTNIDNVQKKIDKIVPAHLESEKKMRMRRLRLEARLDTQKTKFDDAMLKRQMEIDQLIAEINELKERLDEIQEKIKAQEETYQIMVDEKLDEEQWEWNAKRHYILMVQCARRIQRYWRAYKARCNAAKAAEERAKQAKARRAERKAKRWVKKHPMAMVKAKVQSNPNFGRPAKKKK